MPNGISDARNLDLDGDGPNTKSAQRAQAWQVAEQIRQMIVRGTLSPGVHLNQADLAKSFGVSRFPVREALKLLAAETLVLHDLNRGFFVTALSSAEARQLYRLRTLVETDLFQHMAWPEAHRIKRLEVLLNNLEKSVRKNQRHEWANLHGDFQRAFIQLSDQDVMVREAERLWTLTERYRALLPIYSVATSTTGFQMVRRKEIFDALTSRDRRALIRAADLGRQEALQAVLALLEARGL